MADKQAKADPAAGKKVVKILMLHGYTQSGALFRNKTRSLDKLLQKSLAPSGLFPKLIFPTAPIRLLPDQIPGFQPRTAEAAEGAEGADPAPPDEPDAWAWWRWDEATGNYRFFDEGLKSLAAPIAEAGGIDGVVGFSQGGALAALLTAALEQPPRKQPSEAKWVDAVRTANGHRALRFAIIYSGFYTPPETLAWLLDPVISTPTLHYIGSLDTIVEESRSRALAERCVDPVVVVHPGGHYVPVSKQWAMPVIGFIKDHAEEPKVEGDVDAAQA